MLTHDSSISWALKEYQDSRSTVCATMALGNTGSDLVTRLSNRLYELCRAGTIQLPSFPDFSGTLAALREGCRSNNTVTYKVCVEQQGNLKILQSMAMKWTETEALSSRAMEAIDEHNKKFNPNGDMWVEDVTLDSASDFGLRNLWNNDQTVVEIW